MARTKLFTTSFRILGPEDIEYLVEFVRSSTTPKKPPFIGERYGLWTVVNPLISTWGGYHMAHCVCECGSEQLVQRGNLRSGSTNACWSCADFGRHRLPLEAAALRKIFDHYVGGARRRRLRFDLSRELVSSLVLSPCVYCGDEKTCHTTKYKSTVWHNGIDRVDNDRGYEKDNVVSCCKRCNYWKLTADVSDFKEHAEKISRKRRSSNENAYVFRR